MLVLPVAVLLAGYAKCFDVFCGLETYLQSIVSSFHAVSCTWCGQCHALALRRCYSYPLHLCLFVLKCNFVFNHYLQHAVPFVFVISTFAAVGPPRFRRVVGGIYVARKIRLSRHRPVKAT